MPSDIEPPKKKSIWKWIWVILVPGGLIVAIFFLIRIIVHWIRRRKLGAVPDTGANPQGDPTQPPAEQEEVDEE